MCTNIHKGLGGKRKFTRINTVAMTRDSKDMGA